MERPIEQMADDLAAPRRIEIADNDRPVEIPVVLAEVGCRRCAGPLDEDLFCSLCGEVTIRVANAA